jgi:hypothetical protein
MNALTPTATGVAIENKWLTMLAQKYKHDVVLLADNKGYSETYFSLNGAPTSKERLMCLGW